MKINKAQLDTIRNIAIRNFVDIPNDGILDDKQFIAKCWVEATITGLRLGLEVEYPEKKNNESIEDVNG